MKLRAVIVNGRMTEVEHLKKLELEPEENVLDFEFDILDYDNPSGHYILCKLEGYDKDWNVLQDVYRQTYRSLPGGDYTFRIKKIANDGTAGIETVLPVSIKTFYYDTVWFKIVMGVLTVAIMYAIMKFYSFRKLEKQRMLLEKQQAVEGERLRISTELHDDVGGELSAIRLVSEMAQMNNLQNPQQQFSKIATSSTELVQKLNEIVWALNVNNDTLQSLVSYIHRYSVKYLDDVGIACRFMQPHAIPALEVDGTIRRNIFLLIKEALNNVVKHAAASGVVITIEINNRLLITIHDNGKGIATEKLTADSGNGLFTMQKRANDLNGTVEIINHDGTTVTFAIPLIQTHTKV